MKKHLPLLVFILSIYNLSAQNLIVNGDFESGGNGVGFITDGAGYSELLAPFSGTTVSGNFALATNPISVNSSIFINAGDHTTGSGKMLIVDGNTTAGSPRFWKAGNAGSGICGLTIGTSYTFSYWVKSISTTVTNASTQAGIGISFTGAGSIVPTPFSSVVPLPASGWKQVVYTFKATATCVSIELWNNNVNATGNDFAVDDFSLTGPQPLSLNYTSQSPTCPGLSNGSISGFGIGGVLPYANYTLTGIIPVVASITNSTGIFTGLSAGTYSLSIKDAVNTVITQNNIVLTTPTDLTVSSGVTNCSSTSTALSVSGGSSGYTWTASPSDPTLTTPNVSNPTVSPTQTTIYTVTSSSVITNDELIYNGDFSLGNVGFSTDYKYLVVSPGAQGRYGITTNANSYWSGFQPCVERLSPGVGKMMVADGSIVNGGNDRVWCQTVAVKPGQNYVFSYWSESIQSATLANIEVLINGVSIAPPASTGGVCNWLKKTINWSSGVSTTAEICIYDRSIISAGNDFAIDDISFKESSATCNLSKSVTVTIPNPINLIITNPSFVCSPGSVDITQPSITAGSTTGTVISYWRDAAGTVPLLNPNSITLSGTYYIKSTIAPCSVIKPVVVDILTNNTISLSSGVGTNAQTVSINTPITTITYNTTGATGATFLGLPSGVNGVWSANTVTISGTPSVSVGSPYSYTVTLTGGCGIISTTGTISVNPNNTISLSSAVGTNAQTVCINAPITTITYTTTGATGATFLGLPSGVNGVWSANTVTISGTPSVSVGSPYTYTVTLTGGAGTISTTGTISVNLNNTVSLSSAVASDAQTVCINAPIANITYTTTGATGATFLGLPSGVNGVWSANTVTISGTPSVSVGSPYSYTVTLTGGCGTVSTTGTISVNPNNIPTFSPVSSICSGDILSPLPTNSLNGITGTWSPVLNNIATTIYTFTPSSNQCSTTANLTINVTSISIPTFTVVNSYCRGTLIPDLPTTSNNGITGTWSPNINNTTTTTYTFIPNVGQCASATTLTLNINSIETPSFIPIDPICAGAILEPLSTTSVNGISGTWSPALNNTLTTEYSFTPNLGQCGTPVKLTITVIPNTTPIFDPISPICSGDFLSPLPNISINGITGFWSPILDNTITKTYNFTPSSGQCATSQTVTILVNSIPEFSISGVCDGTDFVLSSSQENNSDNLTYSWYNALNEKIGSSPSVKITQKGNYTVEVEDGKCKTSKDIEVNSIFCEIPKGISQNDDQRNDSFDLRNLSVNKLEIFDRYGVKVYSKLNYQNEWDGTSDKGQKLPDGTYYYVVEFKSGKSKTGWVYLNR